MAAPGNVALSRRSWPGVLDQVEPAGHRHAADLDRFSPLAETGGLDGTGSYGMNEKEGSACRPFLAWVWTDMDSSAVHSVAPGTSMGTQDCYPADALGHREHTMTISETLVACSDLRGIPVPHWEG